MESSPGQIDDFWGRLLLHLERCASTLQSDVGGFNEEARIVTLAEHCSLSIEAKTQVQATPARWWFQGAGKGCQISNLLKSN